MIKNLTKKVLEQCDLSWNRFMHFREIEKEPDFFTEVKPYADEVHTLIDEWEKESLQWITVHRPKYVHPPQIENAAEQMKQFVVQSFYIKTSKKRFYESIQAAKYTCDTLLQAIRSEEHGEQA